VFFPVRSVWIVAGFVFITFRPVRFELFIKCVDFRLAYSSLLAQQHFYKFVHSYQRFMSPVGHSADTNGKVTVGVEEPISAGWVTLLIVRYYFNLNIHRFLSLEMNSSGVGGAISLIHSESIAFRDIASMKPGNSYGSPSPPLLTMSELPPGKS